MSKKYYMKYLNFEMVVLLFSVGDKKKNYNLLFLHVTGGLM